MAKYPLRALHNPTGLDRRTSNPNVLPLTEVDPAWIAEIQAYLKTRRSRLEVGATTRTRAGQILDWIPIESQVKGGRIATPPPAALEEAPRTRQRDKLKERFTRFELERQKSARGPRGMVPVRRKLVQELLPVCALRHFLSKHPRDTWKLRVTDELEVEVPAPSANGHWYASAGQDVTCYGTDGYIAAYAPYVEWSDEFSLGQNALLRGTGTSRQTVEAGWQTYKTLYGDWQPHLFVFYSTNGHTQSGDNLGGYNQDVDGWVQYSSRVYPEALSSPVSIRGGTQYVMYLKWQLWEGNWWLKCNANWIGYYPASLFSTSGLRNRASQVQWFGEVADSPSVAGTTATDMGSGHWPYEEWPWCAYMRNLRYQSDAGGARTRLNGWTFKNDRECYDIEEEFANTGSWASYFWWGGSGRNAKCP